MRSSYCTGGECVEVEIYGPYVVLTTTSDVERVITATHDEWVAFVAGVKNGEFDIEKLLGYDDPNSET